ncbi:hypothetical protein A2U01_0076236, partial [Trifolium medium]|nr:hypothetical protein [Trifolium medium]
MLEAAECDDDKWVANVGVWPGDHALNTPCNNLAYLYMLPSHDGKNDM